VYEDWYRNVEWFPDVYIYLSSRPEKCMQRIMSRQQTGDQAVTLEYLQSIHELYEATSRKKHVIYVEGKTPEAIHKEILSVLRANNAMFLSHLDRPEMPKAGNARRQVLCAPPANMCYMS